MKAIILAAGVGKRFKEVTDQRPKCLIAIQGQTLLERTLRALGAAGVTNAVVVIGYRGDMIKQTIGSRCGAVQVRYIFNRQYEKGAILSLWSARAEFDDDILIMDADVVFPMALIARLVNSAYANCFLLDGSAANTGEEQMLLTRGGRVLNIVRGGSGDFDVIGESVGFLKVSRADAPLLRSILDDLVAQGQEAIEHEEAFSIFLAQRVVGFERVDDLPWTEIDFPEDLVRAESEVLPRILALDRARTES
ncbi:MAG TPA: phosphocholine cytidylyltransferase family protein [Methylomirabilota bacterium]|jgi:choline kinase|nr:phosphocholine cytidylyltransferase family protein [Methylomirabilota bacterium]